MFVSDHVYMFVVKLFRVLPGGLAKRKMVMYMCSAGRASGTSCWQRRCFNVNDDLRWGQFYEISGPLVDEAFGSYEEVAERKAVLKTVSFLLFIFCQTQFRLCVVIHGGCSALNYDRRSVLNL